MNNISKVLIFVFFLVVCISPNILAKENLKTSASYCDEGIEYFEADNIGMAASFFAKALIVDSTNDVARKHMQNILKDDMWTRRHKLVLMRFIELIDYYNFLIVRINTTIGENDNISKDILNVGEYDENLVQEVVALESGVDSNSVIEKLKDILSVEKLNSIDILDNYNTRLGDKKKELMDSLIELQRTNQKLRLLKIKVVKNKKKKPKIEIASQSMIQEITAIKEKLRNKENALLKQEKNIASLKKELVSVRSEYTVVQEKLKGMDKKLADVTKELAGMTLEKFEREIELKEKDKKIEKLEDNYNETLGRLTLAQHIIQEKNIQISKLEEANGIFEKNNISQKMADLKEKTVSMTNIEESSLTKDEDKLPLTFMKISRLELKIQDLSKKYSSLESVLEKREEEISFLRRTLGQKDKTISSLKRVYMLKDRKLGQSKGILEIYKAKLSDMHAFLQEKNKKMNILKRELEDLKSDIKQKKRTIYKNSMQYRLNRLFKYRMNLGSINSLPDEILKRTKEDLDSLQYYLSNIDSHSTRKQ